LPSTVEAVITAVPGLTAVIFPLLTLAMPELPEIHITVLYVALAGVTEAVMVLVSPIFKLRFDLLKLIPVTGITALPVGLYFAVICALPARVTVVVNAEGAEAVPPVTTQPSNS